MYKPWLAGTMPSEASKKAVEALESHRHCWHQVSFGRPLEELVRDCCTCPTRQSYLQAVVYSGPEKKGLVVEE